MVLDRTDGAACFIEGQATRSAFGSVNATPLALAYNSFAVVTIGAGGSIRVNPDGDGYTFPTTDGSANQVLQTDGEGNLSFATVSGGGGLSNIVEDTTPQLGGNLDLNSNDITGTGNIDITGTLNVSGVTTSTSFSGSGENLTGIVTSITAGTGVSVNLAGSEYTVSLSSTNVNKLASTYNSVVAAGTNVSSVSSSSVTAGDVTTTTYTVNATDTVVESMFVEVLLSFPKGAVPTYSITSQDKYGTVFQTITDAIGINPLLDIENGAVVLDWQQNFVSITVQNFFSGGAVDYYPTVYIQEEVTWQKGVRGGQTTINGDKAIFLADIYDKNASDFKIRFLNPKKMLGSDVENQLSSLKLIFKINA